jgi:hypothetical protein
MEETTWRKSDQISLQEGFNLLGDDLFYKCKTANNYQNAIW